MDTVNTAALPKGKIYQDKGWAWFCLLGGILMNCIVAGSIHRSFSLLFDDLQTTYNTTAGKISFLPSLALSLMMLTAIPANGLSLRFGTRRVVMTGGILVAVGFLSCSQVSTVYALYPTYGLFVGIGTGLVFSPTMVFVSSYFFKYRSMAIGLVGAGSGIGGILFTPIIKYILEEYAVKGTMIILAGFGLQLLIAGALYRPISFYYTNVKLDLFTDISADIRLTNLKKGDVHFNLAFDTDKSVDSITDKSTSNSADKSSDKTTDNDCENAGSIPNKEDKTGNDVAVKDKSSTDKANSGKSLEFYLLKDPVLWIYAMSNAISMSCFISSFLMIAPHVKNIGHTGNSASMVIQVTGGCDIVTRIFVGWFGGKCYTTKDRIFQVSLAVGIVSFAVVPFSDNIVFVTLFVAVCTTSCGSIISQMPSLCSTVFGEKHMPTTYGFVSFLAGIWALAFPTVMGKLRDATGDWKYSYWMNSLAMALALSLQLVASLLKKNQIHRRYFVDNQS